jgi:hypothetical protein
MRAHHRVDQRHAAVQFNLFDIIEQQSALLIGQLVPEPQEMALSTAPKSAFDLLKTRGNSGHVRWPLLSHSAGPADRIDIEMNHNKTTRSPAPVDWKPTRREALAAAAAGTVALLAGPRGARAQQSRPAPVSPRSSPPAQAPWWMQTPDRRARVVDMRSGGVLHASAVDRVALSELLEQGMQALTGATTEEASWRSVLGSAERIVLKFNSVGADIINTNSAMAQLLVERLEAAGYARETVALVEAPPHVAKQLGTRTAVVGWDTEIQVGGNPEPLARYACDADAIINVPLLKTHQIAGMSACMKNLSHALIRHPARYHANGCAPYVGQVVSSKEVSSRLKLNVVNALRIVVDRGPDAQQEHIEPYGGLLLGCDPVAVDNVGLSILATERRRRGLSGGGAVRYLASAAEMGIGRWRPGEIDRVVLGVDD